MKANGITCTDYAVQGEQLVLCLTGTTMEDALAMERSVIKITTDDGVQVEALPGYENAVSVTYLADTGVYQLTLTRAAQQGVGAALDALAADNTALRGELAEITTEAVRTRAAAMAFAAGATTITDGQALTMPGLFPTWEEVLDAGQPLKKGQVIDNGGTLYRVEQESVTPQAHQPPGGEGMLAVYRPIAPGHAGTQEDPIPWVYGMDCPEGKYYSYNGNTYLVAEGGSMIPCVWAPGTAGLWQWVLVSE